MPGHVRRIPAVGKGAHCSSHTSNRLWSGLSQELADPDTMLPKRSYEIRRGWGTIVTPRANENDNIAPQSAQFSKWHSPTG